MFYILYTYIVYVISPYMYIDIYGERTYTIYTYIIYIVG